MTRPNKTFLRLTAFQRDRAPGHNVAQSAVAKWANSAYTQQIRVGEPMSMKRLFSRECIGQHSVSRRSFLSVTLGGLAAVGLGPTIAFSADENAELNQKLDASIRRALTWLAAEQQVSGMDNQRLRRFHCYDCVGDHVVFGRRTCTGRRSVWSPHDARSRLAVISTA